jgi:hypothetical protein
MDIPTIVTTVLSILAPVGASATALWKWIVRQLDECKAKHAESLVKIDNLHDELRTLSEDVGNMRGQLSVYQSRKNTEKGVDVTPTP